MTTAEPQPSAPSERFRDDLIQPFCVLAMIGSTAARWSDGRVLFPAVALPLFVAASIAAVGALAPWTRLGNGQQVAAVTAYMVLSALLLPLTHAINGAAFFPYIAARAVGVKLASRKAAASVAVTGALTAAGATWLVALLAPDAPQWQGWVTLTVGLPVYIGMSNQDRVDALHHARLAAQEAQRAKASEAREAALIERGRIAREIHDVLGHSLSGIALQLDMADALRDSGRADEATAAVRRARALAVDSISETRSAVHALRENTLPLPDTLRRLAEHNTVDFAIDGDAFEVGAEATHTMVRTAQEALTNAAKHAPGAERSIRLAFTDDRVTLTVCNGPATEAIRTELATGTGVGLVGMRERAALLGGTLQSGPTREGGWTVELELPQ